MTKIGMLYICTGKYTVFWPEFYRSFEEKFLPGCEKEYFVFTDAPAIEYEDAPRVHRIYQEAYPWPYSTLKRFSIFLTQEDALRGMDYLFFFNANLTGLLCSGCGAGDCDLLCLSALAADGYAGRFLYRHGGGSALSGAGLYPPRRLSV